MKGSFLMKYAITAATGNFGQAAVKALLEKIAKEDLIIIARNLEKAQKLFAGLTIRQASYDSVEEMTQALTGVDKVLFISSQPGGAVSRDVQHQNVVKALKAANVNYVAYTSYPHAQTAKSWLAADHKLTEDTIKASGLSHSFLRNNWYLENEFGLINGAISGQNQAYWAENKTGWALEREYAQAAVNVLLADQPKEVYEFAGTPLSYDQLAAALKEVNADAGEVTHLTQAEYVATLEKTGLDHDTAALYASFQEPNNVGDLQNASADLAEVLGHEPLDIVSALKEITNR